MIANLVRWEWFKLQRRWMLWILLTFAILFGQLGMWGPFFSYQSLQSSGGEITVPSSLRAPGVPTTLACNDLLSGDAARRPAGLDAQVIAGYVVQCGQQAATLPTRLDRLYQDFTLPGSVPAALRVLQMLALILIAILTASAIGIDYGSGTLRSVLSKGTGRWQYLTAKIVTIAMLAAIGLVLVLSTVVISSVIAQAILLNDGTEARATTATWADAGIALWKAWVSVLPYLALAAFVTVLARSPAVGMAIGLGYYFLEQIVIALFSGLFSWFQNVADFLLVRNINAWTQGTGAPLGPAALGGPLPDPMRAIVLLALYTLVFGGVAFWLFERRDVQGATSG